MSDSKKIVDKFHQLNQTHCNKNARPSSPWWRRFSRFRRFFNRRRKRKIVPTSPKSIDEVSPHTTTDFQTKVSEAQDLSIVDSGSRDGPAGKLFKRLEDEILIKYGSPSPNTRRRQKEEVKREKERKKWDDLQKEIRDVLGNSEEFSIAIDSPKQSTTPKPQTQSTKNPKPLPETSSDPAADVNKYSIGFKLSNTSTVSKETNCSIPTDIKNKRKKLNEVFRLARVCKSSRKQVKPKELVDDGAQTPTKQRSEVGTMTKPFDMADKTTNTVKVKTLSKCVQVERAARHINSIDKVAATLTVNTKTAAVYDKVTVYSNNLQFNDGFEDESYDSFRMNEDREELEYFAKYWEKAKVNTYDVTQQDKEAVAEFLDLKDSDDSSDQYDVDDSPLTNVDQQLNSIITLSRCLIQQVERTRSDWAKVCQSPVPDCLGMHRGEVLDLIAWNLRRECSRRMEMVSYNMQNVGKLQELVDDVRFDQECYMRRLKDLCDIKADKRFFKKKGKPKKNLKSREQARKEQQFRMTKSIGLMEPITEVQEIEE